MLLVESTYGDRLHQAGGIDALAQIITEAAAREQTLLVPAFAVDRTQELLYVLRALEDQGRISALPVFIDIPMATDVTEIYARIPRSTISTCGGSLAGAPSPPVI